MSEVEDLARKYRLEDRVADRDETYRAIGRYLVEFSQLIATMREMISEETARDSGPRVSELLQLSLGELTAEPITQTFFAMCRTACELDDQEQKIERVLREKHVVSEIRRRNAIAHGDWMVPRWAFPKGPPHVATLYRVKTSDKNNPVRYEDLPTKKIDEEADRVEMLEWMVLEFSCICTNNDGMGRRVRDAFEIVGSSNKPSVRFRAGYSTQIIPPSERMEGP